MKWTGILAVVVALVGCKPALSPEVLHEYQSRSLMTCCNMHYESDEITDANYYVGTTVPFGTPVQIQQVGRDSVTFLADGKKLTLYHKYGTDQETLRQYLDKVLVATSPKSRAASFPRAVQDAIRDGRVERGMTREQVILSLGYPPTHRTPSLTAAEWLYWYNRWVSYKVLFNDAGVVTQVVGRPAPTTDQPIQPEIERKATPKPKPAKRRR
jgi:hypothetical protein